MFWVSTRCLTIPLQTPKERIVTYSILTSAMVHKGEYALENIVTQVLVVHLYDHHLPEEIIYSYH